MTKRFRRTSILTAVASALVVSGAANSSSSSQQLRLADAKLIVEVNATDGDAGLQVFLDGEPWRAMAISGPNGRKIVAINAQGSLRGYGLTELFSESSEPPFKVLPLAKFKALFPAGKYTFRGTTIDGKRLTGSAILSHDIPAGPKIVAPEEDAAVSRGSTVVAKWQPAAEPAGVDVVAYRVIVTREDPLRELSIDLAAPAKSVTIPSEFLESRAEYKLEVQAIEASGNQTLTEIAFTVR